MSALVDLVWSEPHYKNHLLPIFQALPPEHRGVVLPRSESPRPGNIGLAAGWKDVEQYLRGWNSYFYVEHGAGQTYSDALHRPEYSANGGARFHGCYGFICPRQEVADRWTSAPSIAVGCPKLDAYVDKPAVDPYNVCIAFHWDGQISPEARSAFPFYGPWLPAIVEHLQAEGMTVFGHGHPRWEGYIDGPMGHAGMTVLKTEEEVFDQCGSLIMDNSSLQFEFAALGRPVAVLNAPWYRRDVHHGLRFWDRVPGRQIDDPQSLLDLSWPLLFPEPELFIDMGTVYAHRDGSSSRRAAAFIVQRLQEMGLA